MELDFKKKILKNGMTILFEKRNLPVVSVAIAVRAGGVNEDISEKGISHFIEHMLYKGTKKRSYKQIAEDIEKNGGELNGFTSEEVTGYYCKMPSKHLNLALDVLSDIVKNSVFDEKEMEKEKKVIFEEIKMYKDNPQLHCFSEIQKLLYTGTLGMDLAGTFESVSKIKRKDVLDKFKKIYTPNNLILCVVGDADFENILGFAEGNFGNEKSELLSRKSKLQNKIKTEEREGVDQANAVFAFHIPLAGDKKCYAAKVLSSLMTGGMSSRLFEEIREKRNLAYSVSGDSSINKNFAYNFIYIGTMKKNLERIKKIILEEFDKVSKQLNDGELKRMKEQIIGNYQISMEDSQSQMMNLLIAEIQRDAKNFYEFEKNILEVKLNDVKELAKKATKEYSFFALVPKWKKGLNVD